MALAEQELTQNALANHQSSDEDGEARPLLWTKEQYHRIGDAGVFGDVRVELIEGVIIKMSPIGSRHFTSVGLTTQVLSRVFGAGHFVMAQNGFSANPRSEPQPDVAVYPGDIRDYTAALPTTALLVVEVADTTLRSDRDRKARLYAGSQVPEYWIINLRAEVLEVYRQPLADSDGPVAYQSVQTLTRKDAVAPLAASSASILVADLLP